MEITIERKDILDKIQNAANNAATKLPSQFLCSIWLNINQDMLTISATDGNIEYLGEYTLDVPQDDAIIGVDGKTISELVKRLPDGEITLKTDSKNNLLISQGRKKYNLPITASEFYQNTSVFPDNKNALLDGAKLLEVLDGIGFCIDNDKTQDNALSCICFKPIDSGKIEISGMDGHKFAMHTIIDNGFCEVMPENGVLFQGRFISSLTRWLDASMVRIAINNRRIYFKKDVENETLSIPIVSLEYPDYNIFLKCFQDNENLNTMEMTRAALIDSINRLQIFNTGTSVETVMFQLTESELCLSDSGCKNKEYLDISYDGSLDKISFPNRDMATMLTHFNAENIQLVFTGIEGPCMIKDPENENYFTIIMPLKTTVSEPNYEEE